MATAVDNELLQLYILGELDDASAAKVEALVADDPAWAKALQAEAQLEMAMFTVVDAVPTSAAPAPAPARSWWSWFRLPTLIPTLVVAATVVFFVAPRSADHDVTWHLEVQGGESAQRGAPVAGEATYTTGSLITLIVRPETRTDDDHRVSLWIDGKPVKIPVTHEDGGAITISGVFGETLPVLTPGHHQLQINIDDHAYAHPFTWKDAR